MNIRTDKTKINRENRSSWELGVLGNTTDREAEKQKNLLEYWGSLGTNHNKGETAEMEIARRVSASSEGDNATVRNRERVQTIKIEGRVAEIRKEREAHFEEEDLASERKKFGNQYR